MLSRLWRLIPLLLVGPASLAAQATLDRVARQIWAGQRVRLHLRDGQYVEGRFAAYAPGSPTLRISAADTLIPIGVVDSLWVRGRAAGRGAIIGALVVGVPSAIFWGALCTTIVASEGSDGTGCTGAVVIGLTAGAGVGALLGTAIGSAFPRWRLRYASASVGLRVTPLPEHRVGVGFSLQFRTGLR